jgi:hypothetical protein
MGVSSSASNFIGFLVSYDDFWNPTVQMGKVPECPNGHGPGVAGKFCQECGAKIEIQKKTVYVPTSKFKAFCDANNLVPDEVWQSDPKAQRYLEELYDRSALGELELECVDPIDGSEHEAQYVALGRSVLSVRGICSGRGDGLNVLNFDEIKKHWQEIEQVRNALGIDRQVKMYLCGYCSY